MVRTWPMDRQRSLVVAAALIPVIWSAVAAVVPASPGSVPKAPPIAPLAFDQYLVNLRNVGLRPVVQGEFHFKNVGSEPLTITKLDPSCGCLSPKLSHDQKTYQPGIRGFFVVGVATANETPGPHTYTITVHYEDPEPRVSVLRFKLVLPERKLSIEPPELAFFQYNGEPSTSTVHLTDYRGGDIEVIKAVTTAEFIGIEVQEAQVDKHGHRQIPIVLNIPGVVPPGRTRTMLSIETTDPEFKRIRIPILVDGPSRVVPASAEVTVPIPPQAP